MINKNEISGLGVEIESQGITRFMVFASADGNVKRMGSGRMNDTKGNLCVGQIKDPVFQKMMEALSETLLKYVGKEITFPNQRGIPCKLILRFMVKDRVHSLAINYSHESGYPLDFGVIIKTACEQTQKWYEEFCKKS